MGASAIGILTCYVRVYIRLHLSLMLLWKFEQGKCFKTDETKSQKTEGRVHAHLPLPTYYRISRRFSNRDGSIFLAEAHPSSIKWAECYRWLPIIPTTIRSRREMTIGSFFFFILYTLFVIIHHALKTLEPGMMPVLVYYTTC